MSVEHYDVLVVGAGISGIAAGHYLRARRPGPSYAILEGRASLGGTWDLFRYPGVRSDSDMFTLGYSFRPWRQPRAIAEGPAILAYLKDTAERLGIARHIRFQHRVVAASWSSADSLWAVEAEAGPGRRPARFTCRFLYLCSGYYDYDAGHAPAFPGGEDFAGPIVHPQFWPDGLDYRGKRVCVIGSGATAVTLVPALAKAAAHVTMLQRSPSYVLSVPAQDPLARLLRALLPEGLACWLIRWKNVLLARYLYRVCRRSPERAKNFLLGRLKRELPPGFDIETHFTPRYQPWDQRLCIVPDSDLFRAIRSGRASVVTGRIERITRRGVLLESGQEVEADILVTATGLKLLACGGIRLSADGVAIDPGRRLIYKGVLLGDVPNCAVCVGYVNASWTLRAELSALYVCRLLDEMGRRGATRCVPHADPDVGPGGPLLDLTSGYIQRGAGLFPNQGAKAPWSMPQDYLLDLMSLYFGELDDGTLVFSQGPPR